MAARPFGLLVDMARCIGCRACVLACKEIRGFPGDETATELSATAYTAIRELGDVPVRQLCMHCLDPTCASVCPVGALQKTPTGPVVYKVDRCIGCRYCMLACPFQVPRYEWSRAVPEVRKCDMCVGRQAAGEQPGCAEACPVEATVFGPRDELLVEARRRLADEPDLYHPHIFGETELGGTSILFLSPVAFEELDFPTGLGNAPLPQLTKKALEKIPGLITVGGAALLALWWITNRRDQVAAWEAAQAGGTIGTYNPAAGHREDTDGDR